CEIGGTYLRKHQGVRELRPGGRIGVVALDDGGRAPTVVAQRIDGRRTTERRADGNLAPGIPAGIVAGEKAFQPDARLPTGVSQSIMGGHDDENTHGRSKARFDPRVAGPADRTLPRRERPALSGPPAICTERARGKRDCTLSENAHCPKCTRPKCTLHARRS